jgi:RNA polymerase sigma factor (TIGR02999 family)
MSNLTQLLGAVDDGDPKAADQLLPLVYEELRRLAASKIAHEKPGQTLQATALVHEAWLRLAGSNHQQWRGRCHFFGAAAEAMRRILIDEARPKASLKRGLDQPLEELHESRIEMAAPSDEILAVHEALDALAAEDATAAEVVKLRYFVAMTIPEIAEAPGNIATQRRPALGLCPGLAQRRDPWRLVLKKNESLVACLTGRLRHCW